MTLSSSKKPPKHQKPKLEHDRCWVWRTWAVSVGLQLPAASVVAPSEAAVSHYYGGLELCLIRRPWEVCEDDFAIKTAANGYLEYSVSFCHTSLTFLLL